MKVDQVRCYHCGDMFEPWTNERYCSDRCHDDANRPKPLPVGTPVHHSGQQWARGQRATATIAAVRGPWPDGAFEYLVYHRGPFSGGVGPAAPPSWWASYRTVPIEEMQ